MRKGGTIMKKIILFSIIGALVIGIAVMPTPSLAKEKGPIRIGYFGPLTGHAAQTGRNMLSGLEVYLISQNWQVAGRKIKLFTADTETKPAVALTKVRKLVEKDRCHVILGGLLASTGYALQPYVDKKKVPTNYPVMAPDDLTQRKRAKWIIRSGWSSSQPNHPFGEYAYKVLGFRKVVTIGYDYAFGWENVGGFQKTFEELGGRIIQKLWTPVGAQEYGPYLGRIRKDTDAVYGLFFGSGSLQFVKQYKDYGLKDKFPLIGGGTTTDEHVLPSMGDEAIGIITTLHYSAALDNPANKKFVAAFRKHAKRSADYYSAFAHTGGKWIIESIKAINGDVENREKFLKAMKNLKITETPRGDFYLDKYGNPVQNAYIRKVERVGGELQNTVIKTYPKVSQFWKYKPEEFLKQPVYSRDYPPLKK
jgi:branched-chain amino acid transport system substrate-binding protein